MLPYPPHALQVEAARFTLYCYAQATLVLTVAVTPYCQGAVAGDISTLCKRATGLTAILKLIPIPSLTNLIEKTGL
jgi:hypothetical protein